MRPWHWAHEMFLEHMASRHGFKYTVGKLGRTKSDVRNKALSLGLKFLGKPGRPRKKA